MESLLKWALEAPQNTIILVSFMAYLTFLVTIIVSAFKPITYNYTTINKIGDNNENKREH